MRPATGLRLTCAVLALGLIAVLAAPAAAQPAPQPAPKKGGALKVALIGEPPTLDMHTTTATITREIMVNVMETLFTLDARYQPVPLLAEGYEALDGAKRHVIRLRKGIRFHNGKELTAADVVASLKRWGAVSGPGKAVFRTLESIEASGPSTVDIRLREPSATLPVALAQLATAAVIYPKEIVDGAGEEPVKEYVGTGPFRFVEHRPDRHIKLARFDGYQSRAEAPNGLGGQRVAWVDEIYFLPVPDYATRQAGIQTGEYHYVQQLKADQFDRLRAMPGVEPLAIKPFGWATWVLNAKQGPMADKRLRQAIQAAIDIEPMMLAAMGNKEFYRLDPGLFFQEQAAWHSKAGAELYNQRDKDKARRLLREAGYQGQPIRWIVTTEYEHHYKPALVGKAQLEEVGFKIDLQVSDWATVVQRRNKPELWDIFSTAFVIEPEPTTTPIALCSWPGWWCNPDKEQLLQAMGRELDAKKRFALWERLQAIFYEDAARIRLGDYFRVDARRKELQGFRPGPYMAFWNVWLEK